VAVPIDQGTQHTTGFTIGTDQGSFAFSRLRRLTHVRSRSTIGTSCSLPQHSSVWNLDRCPWSAPVAQASGAVDTLPAHRLIPRYDGDAWSRSANRNRSLVRTKYTPVVKRAAQALRHLPVVLAACLVWGGLASATVINPPVSEPAVSASVAQHLAGSLVLDSLTVPSGETWLIEDDLELHVTGPVVIAGALRAQGRMPGTAVNCGVSIRIVSQSMIEITGDILAGNGSDAFGGPAHAANVSMRGGVGGGIQLSAPVVIVDGRVIAGSGGRSGSGAAGGDGGCIVVQGTATSRRSLGLLAEVSYESRAQQLKTGGWGLFAGNGGGHLSGNDSIADEPGAGGNGGSVNIQAFDGQPMVSTEVAGAPPHASPDVLFAFAASCPNGNNGYGPVPAFGADGAAGAPGANGTVSSPGGATGGAGGNGGHSSASNGTSGGVGSSCCPGAGGTGGRGGYGGSALGGKGGRGGQGGSGYYDVSIPGYTGPGGNGGIGGNGGNGAGGAGGNGGNGGMADGPGGAGGNGGVGTGGNPGRGGTAGIGSVAGAAGADGIAGTGTTGPDGAVGAEGGMCP